MSALIVRVEHLHNIDTSCHHAGIIVGDHTTELVAVELVDMFGMSLTNCIVGQSLPIIYQRTGAEASCFPRHNFKNQTQFVLVQDISTWRVDAVNAFNSSDVPLPNSWSNTSKHHTHNQKVVALKQSTHVGTLHNYNQINIIATSELLNLDFRAKLLDLVGILGLPRLWVANIIRWAFWLLPRRLPRLYV